ncbi:hypothetical protein R4Q14_01815 [Brachyspira intermedia]|uniref:hypothetical protein n=1 Tax=Brachyspira intermedia TaxID=84377 RepID=UPI003006774B
MQKQIKFFTTLLMVLFLTISCSKSNPSNPDNENTGNNSDPTKWKDKANYSLLQQVWAGSASVFKYVNNEQAYTAALNSYVQYPKTMNYTLTIESIIWTSETDGIMYGKCNYSLNPALNKKYLAIAFRNLTASNVELCEGSLSGKEYAETLEEAQSTFTAASGAFTSYDNYTVYNQ